LVVVVVALLGAVAPAHATTVTVTLDVSRGYPPAVVPVAHCNVGVPVGADGIDVLNAGVASGCISSYQAPLSQYGHYVTCINSDCEAPAGDPTLHGTLLYWRISENGKPACVGVDGFTAAQGKVLGFTFTPTATAAADIAIIIATGCPE
jgi:hypothetical protein